MQYIVKLGKFVIVWRKQIGQESGKTSREGGSEHRLCRTTTQPEHREEHALEGWLAGRRRHKLALPRGDGELGVHPHHSPAIAPIILSF
jgi:hypothetical protein